ncbi:hypothetical protein L2E82_44952 [Cichorium intybus]|uniref:Uncharacterized protein n=1 Tax=Cichorium intybus TaxID=13427 RepID=A0ACB8ZRI5_CICIN|nr:hypothetical protein L2E82_44952 [Cichorium intybus]
MAVKTAAIMRAAYYLVDPGGSDIAAYYCSGESDDVEKDEKSADDEEYLGSRWLPLVWYRRWRDVDRRKKMMMMIAADF